MAIINEQILYTLLILLMAINLIIGFANNFIVVGYDPENTSLPEYFSLNKGEDTYTFSYLQGALVQLRVNFQNTISDISLSSLLSFINAFLNALGTLGNLLINLATGYMRLTQVLLSPLDIVTGATAGYGMGRFIADMVNVIITAIVVIGFFEWLKSIVASVTGAI